MASGDTLVFTPLANEPPAVQAATADERNGHAVLDFGKAANQSAVFSAVLPSSYAGRGLTVRLHYAMTEAASGAVDWDVAFERIGRRRQSLDEDGFGPVASADGNPVPPQAGLVDCVRLALADGDQLDHLAAGEAFRVRVTRDSQNDTASGDAELLFVVIEES